jgi:alpha-tubulin suppressor-like RCC1 family protein
MTSTTYNSVLLVDKDIYDYQIFIDSSNIHTLPIAYTCDTTKNEILSILNTVESFDRLCFCFISDKYLSKMFLDRERLFSYDEKVPYSNNFQFIVDIVKKFNVKYIDFLACNTLQYDTWKKFFEVLANATNTIIGASNNQTGNLLHSGDWILESTNQDIQQIYFNSNINNYHYLLDSGGKIIVKTNDNKLYGSGTVFRGVLSIDLAAIGSPANVNTFTLMTQPASMSGKIVKTIVSGYEHSAILYETGEAFATGNNQYGVLGNNTFTSSNYFTAIDRTNIPVGVQIVDMCGYLQVNYLLTDVGTIYSCGANDNGNLGIGSVGTHTKQYTQMIMSHLPVNVWAVAFACGFGHVMVLMNNNTVWGCGTGFRLGLGPVDSITNNPTLKQMDLSSLPLGVRPVGVFCGNYTTFILTNAGTVYGCGSNSSGQLGNGTTTDTSIITQMNLSALNTAGGEKVISISGNFPTTVVMTNLAVYECGRRTLGPENVNVSTLQLIYSSVTPVPNAVIPKAITNGEGNTFILMVDGTIMGCGNSSRGSLPVGYVDTANSRQLTLALLNIWNGTVLTPMGNIDILMNTRNPLNIPCFNYNTKILCLNDNLEEEYIPIQNLKKGDLVKSYVYGYRKIESISSKNMINNPNVYNKCMYKMKKTDDNGLIEDLILTGGHSILVDNLGEYKKKDIDENTYIKIVDKFLLLSAVSLDFTKLEDNNMYTYYNFVLENNGNDDERFGVWASGILVESTSKNEFNSCKYNTD